MLRPAEGAQSSEGLRHRRKGRGRQADVKESAKRKAFLASLKENNPAAFNNIREPEFVRWLGEKVDTEEKVLRAKVRGSAAAKFNVSIQTIKNWLEKHCSDEGDFEEAEGGEIKRRVW